MNGDAGDSGAGKGGALARKLWLFYALATVTAALVLLAAYVNIYDDYDVGPRLRGLGLFTRRAMAALGFPSSLPATLLTGPLVAAFGCGDENDPCAIFVMWQTLFVALVAQIALLRWAIGRALRR
ncbi:MAG: hypothetical protein EKK29_12435 [Hyphomicrobiales bacterium]|nr:MAG: hypothetical protein EKK29_12435 [Hyphomicrobiales bacterium]